MAEQGPIPTRRDGARAPLAFEVASVKPVPPSVPTAGSAWIATHGRFKAETAYIRFMIGWAYNVLAPQVQGGPDWIDQERYYVDAGLQLQAAKGPVEVLVIDNIEKPSPN